MKCITKTLYEWRDLSSSWINTPYIVVFNILYKFNTTSIKILAEFQVEIDKLVLK